MDRHLDTGVSAGRDPGRLLAAATIFSGAFLLFEVEPMIAKAILPWFGGSAQVWTTCLLFFQGALLAGYLYAHFLSGRVSPRLQPRIHIALLLASLALLPILPSERWRPLGGENPLPLILGLLAATIGLPFMLLSATSPLVQVWLTRNPTRGTSASPYRLFALSNFGSMLALLSYPVLVEPNIPLRAQAWSWSALYGVFVLLCATVAWRYRTDEAHIIAERGAGDDTPSWAQRLLWFGLAAMPSALLLAMTNYILQNVAAIPLFWVIPLALYLLSFIFAFGSLRWFRLPLWYEIFAGTMAALILALSGDFGRNELALLPLIAGALFICCMVCHGELATLKPPPRHLTAYYLIIASGGAAGGLFVAAFAPAVFNAPYELPILVPATVLLVIVAAGRHYRDWAQQARGAILAGSGLVIFAATTFYMARASYLEYSGNLVLARNFYGSLRVMEIGALPADDTRRTLMNGNILHGEEFTAPEKRRAPLTYYSRVSGIGIVLDELGKGGPLRVGVIGLGAGTIAAYGRSGDVYRFYDINPLVPAIARNDFWYLKTNPAETSIALGDARLSLESEPPQRFDVLAVDAFTSDSIPIHLLTRQAFALYWRHLKPDGVLAVHVSNRYVDLAPIVAAAAVAREKTVRRIANPTDDSEGISRADWVLVTSRPGLFEQGGLIRSETVSIPPGLREWTDDYSNLWQVLKIHP